MNLQDFLTIVLYCFMGITMAVGLLQIAKEILAFFPSYTLPEQATLVVEINEDSKWAEFAMIEGLSAAKKHHNCRLVILCNSTSEETLFLARIFAREHWVEICENSTELARTFNCKNP